MTNGELLRLIRDFSGCDPRPGDEELLARFARQHDEAAFEEILHRHGPMVLAICRRVLGQTADADDAFQATFLVLVRKARAVRRPELLANWLCAVAYRAARQALRRRSRTAARERQVERLPEPGYEPAPPPDWVPLFDAALQRLPGKFREPLVLCELRGWSRARAARLLGVNENTLSSRLARGRKLLRRRLGHLGFPLAAGAALAPIAVPNALAGSALRHAAAPLPGMVISQSILQLTERVAGEMVATAKLKAAAVVLAVVLLVAGISMRASSPTIEAMPPAPPAAKAPDKPAEQPLDRERLQGSWKVIQIAGNGPPIDERDTDPPRVWEFDGGRCEVCIPNFGTGVTRVNGGFIPGWDTYAASFVLQPAVDPKGFDITLPGRPEKRLRCGIYELTGDRLTAWFGPDGDPGHRPAAFRFPAGGADYSVVVLQRQKPGPDVARPAAGAPADSHGRPGEVPSASPKRDAVELQLRREIADLRRRLDELEKRLSDLER
jgi:RNA polymerase sigma factor (sigma-70 family)